MDSIKCFVILAWICVDVIINNWKVVLSNGLLFINSISNLSLVNSRCVGMASRRRCPGLSKVASKAVKLNDIILVVSYSLYLLINDELTNYCSRCLCISTRILQIMCVRMLHWLLKSMSCCVGYVFSSMFHLLS